MRKVYFEVETDAIRTLKLPYLYGFNCLYNSMVNVGSYHNEVFFLAVLSDGPLNLANTIPSIIS